MNVKSSVKKGQTMKIKQIIELLDADIVYGEDMIDTEVHSACGCDMMSDVLAFVKDQAVLLTGLCNLQVIRTAEMMDMRCVVFVRGKKPTQDIIDMAKECGIAVLTTDIRMYLACGLLYTNGLASGTTALQ